MIDAITQAQEEAIAHAEAWAGDYNGEECVNCGRHRVMLCNNGKRVCEKCRWSPEENEYVPENIF